MAKVRNQNVDVLWDSKDLRDLIYNPTLIPLKDRLLPQWNKISVLDQKNEGACTGFGLANTINYLNKLQSIDNKVSPRMLYEMAKRYDQWAGRDYTGSTARGAMKGWYKHGVCSEKIWPFIPGKSDDVLSIDRIKAAANCQLGSYFRVLPRRNDVQAALNEVGVIYASAAVHDGWYSAYGKSTISFDPIKNAIGRSNKSGSAVVTGGHAFALVGYTKDGLLVLNSWGEKWGGFKADNKVYGGIALWRYEDFELNIWDLWVARPAVPVNARPEGIGKYVLGQKGSRQVTASPPLADTVGHYIHIDDGQFDTKSEFPSYAEDVKKLITDAVLNGAGTTSPKNILLYAHGGLNSVETAAMRAYKWRNVFPDNNIRCIHFIWETGLLEALKDLLFGKDKFAEERVGAISDWADDIIENAIARPGHSVWHEMQDDAHIAFREDGAGHKVLQWLDEALKQLPDASRPIIHLAGHSAGSIWHAHLLKAWSTISKHEFNSLTLFAPACTHELYENNILWAKNNNLLKAIHHFYLSDEREKDDNVAYIYKKSLLYLVSNALENRKARIPLMGMERFNKSLTKPTNNYIEYIAGKNNETDSKSHGGFDNDKGTMNSLINIIAGAVKRPFNSIELTGY